MAVGKKKTNKSKYEEWIKPDRLLIIQQLTRNGATHEELQDYIGIAPSTFYRWMADFQEFADAVEIGSDEADMLVENALFRRAVGYDYMETHIEKANPRSPRQITKKTVVRKQMAPDVTACAIWLNNRKPDDWKRNRDNYSLTEDENSITIEIKKAKKSTDEIEVIDKNSEE